MILFLFLTLSNWLNHSVFWYDPFGCTGGHQVAFGLGRLSMAGTKRDGFKKPKEEVVPTPGRSQTSTSPVSGPVKLHPQTRHGQTRPTNTSPKRNRAHNFSTKFTALTWVALLSSFASLPSKFIFAVWSNAHCYSHRHSPKFASLLTINIKTDQKRNRGYIGRISFSPFNFLRIHKVPNRVWAWKLNFVR